MPRKNKNYRNKAGRAQLQKKAKRVAKKAGRARQAQFAAKHPKAAAKAGVRPRQTVQVTPTQPQPQAPQMETTPPTDVFEMAPIQPQPEQIQEQGPFGGPQGPGVGIQKPIGHPGQGLGVAAQEGQYQPMPLKPGFGQGPMTRPAGSLFGQQQGTYPHLANTSGSSGGWYQNPQQNLSGAGGALEQAFGYFKNRGQYGG